jgi:ribosomal protein L21E
MRIRKKIRERGKLVREVSLDANFPERLQGRTGVVIGKRGRSYLVKLKDQNKEKEYLIEAIHLKKIEGNKK